MLAALFASPAGRPGLRVKLFGDATQVVHIENTYLLEIKYSIGLWNRNQQHSFSWFH